MTPNPPEGSMTGDAKAGPTHDLSRFVVTYERDEGGWWHAEVQGLDTVLADGHDVDEARRRVRQALARVIGGPAASLVELVDEVRQPSGAERPQGSAEHIAGGPRSMAAPDPESL